ncbi:FAD-dependent monooxygenase [Umezawaea tangerina]|uniref:2-polyprenyl-6-methoxyphenol hydroxylase-like FAD-dependent oxidoreductase n=1 Tax=Umezawaea tangerina TaxID=84725 RepID=A0A2T0SMX2_9PSEU|nr:FAD-dependent monooxygenase [Umezawaea tangerina]PRY34767.1 2-polyprenyl-6-methoxyphenol hydroxylase-like FAD-dependent oxidoreductase [Umezawaea tangerina]
MDVVIVGGGPNGMMLACELALGGVRPVVLERLTEPSAEPRSNGLVGQVVRMVDRRGLFERLSGQPGPPRANNGYFMFAALPLDLSLLDDSPVHNLPVPELRTVQVLEERAVELGVEIRRGHELTGLIQDDDGVTLTVRGPGATTYELRTGYVVGADSAHSPVRKAAGIGFPGVTYDRSTSRTVHATVPADRLDPATGALIVPGHGPVLPFLPVRTARGGFSYAPLPGRPPLVATVEWDEPGTDEPMTLDEMRASVARVLGADVPLGPPPGDGPHLLRRINGGNTRVADRYRDGRVFLVGDAAHVFAAGGTGLNVGMQDAVNLGWKLAAAVTGGADVLDTYETERRPVADRTVTFSRAQAALLSPGDDVTGLRELFGGLLTQPGVVRVLADLVAGADVRYPVDEGAHPLAGWPAPDLDLRTADGAVRLAKLVRRATPLLIDLTEDGGLHVDGVEVVRAKADTEVTALLLRPDSYVAWASSEARPDRDGLRDAARRWFGVPVSS